MENLCLAGGVALNCVANGKVLRDGRFRNIWVQPAAGDAGGALGAALAIYHLHAGGHARALPTRSTAWRAPISGLSSTRLRSRARLTAVGARFTTVARDEMLDTTAQGARRRQGGGLVSGPHGVRPARARQSLDPRRSAQPDHAEEPQSQGQVPRELPAVRAVGAARARGGMVRPRCRQSLHAAGRAGRRAAHATDDRRGRGAVRHRQAQRGALRPSRR